MVSPVPRRVNRSRLVRRVDIDRRDWVELTFDLLPVIGSVSGIARFLLKGIAPHFHRQLSSKTWGV